MDTGKSFEMKLLQSALYFLAGLTSGVAIAISRRGNAGRARRSAQATSEGQQPMKMVLIVNTSLQMGKGKIAAQCAHAACGCVETAERSDAGRRNLRAWRGQGQKKIALATNQENLIRLERSLRSAGINCCLISDAGKTQVAAGSRTVLGVGPDTEDRIDAITRELRLL